MGSSCIVSTFCKHARVKPIIKGSGLINCYLLEFLMEKILEKKKLTSAFQCGI